MLGTRTLSWFGHGCSGHRMLSEHEPHHGLGMDALVIVCSSNTNVIMVWAWMLRSSYALGTRTSSWFRHGCSGHRMLLKHERYHGWGTDALVIVCFSNTNIIMVWAWMLRSSYALGTRTSSWFRHGCSGHRMLLKHERYHGLGTDALVIVCSWSTNVIIVWARCSGHRMLFKHERYHGLGMDAPVIVCSRNTNVIMVSAWMLWSPYALETRTLSWLGHGCSGPCMVLEHQRYYSLGMDALVIVCSWNTNVIMVWAWMLWSPYALRTRTLSWFGHGCSGHRMLFEHERYHGLGMDAPVIVCSRNTNVIMVSAWMLWSPDALETRTLSWLGHGCSGHRMLFKHEYYHGLGMDAPVIVCSRNTNVIMVSAWMLWSPYALETRTLSWLGHGCSGHCVLSEH